MKAIRIHEYGGPDFLQYEEVERPVPDSDEVLVRVRASSVNPVDVGISQGYMKEKLSLDLPVTLGYDIAGTIEEVGANVRNVNVGDKVFGQASIMAGASGAFAEYATTPSNLVARMPENLGFAEAAASVLTGVSALEAIYDHIRLKPGQKILIHGGSGGIGTFAIQIAKHIGAYVITTASGNGVEYAKRLGADEVVDYKSEHFDEVVSGCDAVFDNVGGETYQKSFKVLKKGGIILSMREQPDNELMRRYGVIAQYEFTNTNTASLDELAKLIEERVVTVHIDKTFPLDHVKEAFEDKQKGQVCGKIVIEMV